MKDSMVFYASWLDAIKNLPREMQGEVLTAIIEYGLTGETTASLKPITKAMLALVKTQIDINNKRYENSLKGGRKRKVDDNGKFDVKQTETKPEPKSNQTETKVKPNVNQTETKPEPNVNVNDKETVSTNVEPVKKGTNVPKENAAVAATHATCEPSERYQKFRHWLESEYPYIATHFEKTISEREFEKLLDTYSTKQICDTIGEINNRGDLRKRYTDLYRTVLNWLKREKTSTT